MLWKPKFGFNFGFHDRWRSRFNAILDDCEIGRLCQIQLFNYSCDNFIDNITLTLLTQDKLLALWLIRPCSHSNLENVLVMFVSVWIDFRHRQCNLRIFTLNFDNQCLIRFQHEHLPLDSLFSPISSFYPLVLHYECWTSVLWCEKVTDRFVDTGIHHNIPSYNN